ncbi:MAGUK p55 subfamily member 5-like protein [Dinothrombium tinctorium]|uniref:MAGUK p55 subfamily member 5-like protein n=1 Tax=Dinothrombium tinctorium TaxID=1965070 RepID=A0A3S3PDL1_9ACAR|nr:MAGUK p55 subfamily member 5-like protein [Dinothrombium tinctorium]
MVDLGGYVIVLVEQRGKIKLFGSAAERNDCDEILEINGRNLENATHQQIIQYIHQCIRTRTICLRVKRRTTGKLAIDSSLVDAFVIGSRAREHLQHIARDSNITPRDIAQLSRILSETEDSSRVTTKAVVQCNNRDSESSHEKAKSPADEIVDQKREKEALKEDNTSTSNKAEKVKEKRLQRSDSGEGVIEYYELSDENMELVELNTRNLTPGRQKTQHRELPVDVPESFIGVVKQTPRYPPPPQLKPTVTQPEPEKLKKYNEEVNRKKAEEEFLRSSLRGSKKLQQLEQKEGKKEQNVSQDLHSIVNDAFVADDEVSEDNKVLPLPDLNLVLKRIVQQLNGDAKELITKSNLDKLVAIYTSVMHQKQRKHSLPSMTLAASDLVQEIIILLQEESSISSEAAELLEILTRFELEGLCYAFDRILNSEGEFSSVDLITSDETHNGKPESDIINPDLDSSVRVVRIEKSSCEPLGATVRNEPSGSVIIGRIVRGGAAEKSGLLHEGDEVLEVNGIEMKGRNVNQVCDLLAEMTGTLTFVIAVRDMSKPQHTEHPQVMHLKALFDYDPDDDLYIPCRELGICFSKGDILHVIDQSDPNWWQAYREGEHDQSLAGLIPSVQFQLQREAMKQSILSDKNTATMNYKNRNHKKTSASSILLNCGKRSHHRRKKRKAQNLFSTPDEVLTYEEVCLYYPRANIKRPIVLIGPTNIGRHELRQRLMTDTERFAAAVPHTSRSRREGEIDGIDYHFISRQQFEQDIKDGKFVEHGEYEKNYYGTSLSAIEAVVQSGKICVLNLHVHSIPILRQGNAGAKLKPYFVFVAPPSQLDRLNKLISSTSSGQQQESNNVSTTDLQSIIDEAREIENRYGHYFDMVLSITDIDRAFQELLREINALEREPQWIPSIWVK